MKINCLTLFAPSSKKATVGPSYCTSLPFVSSMKLTEGKIDDPQQQLSRVMGHFRKFHIFINSENLRIIEKTISLLTDMDALFRLCKVSLKTALSIHRNNWNLCKVGKFGFAPSGKGNGRCFIVEVEERIWEVCPVEFA